MTGKRLPAQVLVPKKWIKSYWLHIELNCKSTNNALATERIGKLSQQTPHSCLSELESKACSEVTILSI